MKITNGSVRLLCSIPCCAFILSLSRSVIRAVFYGCHKYNTRINIHLLYAVLPLTLFRYRLVDSHFLLLLSRIVFRCWLLLLMRLLFRNTQEHNSRIFLRTKEWKREKDDDIVPQFKNEEETLWVNTEQARRWEGERRWQRKMKMTCSTNAPTVNYNELNYKCHCVLWMRFDAILFYFGLICVCASPLQPLQRIRCCRRVNYLLICERWALNASKKCE